MIDTDKKRVHAIRTWYIVLINAFVGCAVAAGFPQFSVTISRLSAATGIPQAVLLTGETVKSIGIVSAMLLSGFLYNKLGARSVFLYGNIAAILPLLAIPHIGSVPLLMAVKVLQGSASILFPVSLAIILGRAEGKNAGIATAVFNGIFYGGGGIGGAFAAVIIEKWDWIASYYALAAVQAALCLVWLLTAGETAPKAARAAEVRSASGGARGDKLTDGAFQAALLSVGFLATTFTMQAITVDMPIFGEALGYGSMDVGAIMGAVTAGIFVACVVSGKASDLLAAKTRRKAPARIGVFAAGHVLTVAAAYLIAFGDMSGLRFFLVAVFLFSFAASWGLGSFYPILPELFEAKAVPIVTGICGGVGDLGMPAAPLVVGVFFGLKGFWAAGWGSCAAVAVASLLATLLLLAIPPRKAAGPPV
ncbi:MAG: MFS transporter [Clostridiales Family XIII bacterium]|jgi:MFS family permease|nr:MFS transporter [Clostridiales Family XIII bacterium]